MNALRNIILTSCLLLFCPAFAQQTDVTNIIEGIIEQISENSEREIDVTELVEDLQWFAEHPINLNNAQREEFERLGFLSGLQIENLMFYLYRHSPVVSIYELQLVEGFSELTIQNLLPFVYVGEKTETKRRLLSFSELMKRSRNNVYLRANGSFEEKAGYKSSAKNPYLGEPFYASARYLFSSSNKLFFGVVAEKDEGEPFWTGKHKGFDFYSAHFQIRDVGRFKNIVAGDYRASFGLGLVVSNNFLMGKSSTVLNVTPTTSGLRRSSSMQEYNFLRGVGTTVNFGKFDITAFYSYRKLSAGLAGDTLSSTSFEEDGLFRTEADWEKRNNVSQQIVGGDVTYQGRHFRTGITAMKTWFGATIPASDELGRLYNFSGNEQFNLGWNYSFAVHRFRFAGETATDDHWNFATLNTVTFNPVSNVGIAILQREYSPKYQAFYANSFAEGSSVQNERGLYVGAEIQPIQKWKISAYADSYRFPWMRYRRADRPSDGYDILTQLDYAATSRLSMFLRYRYEEQEWNFNVSDNVTRLVGTHARSSLRYVLNYNFSSNLQFRNTVEFNWVQRETGDDTQGFMMFQDLSYAFPQTPLHLDFRIAVFDIESGENRIYTFERDILWAFSVPGYSGKGSRMFLNGKYSVSDRFSVWFKIAQTIYSDRDAVGSGNELINGNTKTDWRVMINYKF